MHILRVGGWMRQSQPCSLQSPWPVPWHPSAGRAGGHDEERGLVIVMDNVPSWRQMPCR